MQSVIYREDLSPCTVLDYQQNIDKYAGNIECPECKASAWFVRGSRGGLREKAACFAAHHERDCQIKTVILVVDGDEPGPNDGTDTAQIVVDLDKRKPQTILTAEPLKRPPPDSPWGNVQKKYANAADYPINKSLRQILSSLIRNPNFPEDDATIKITADNGRVVLEGAIRNLLSSQYELAGVDLGSIRLFWGLITNVNQHNGSTWLNCGNYRTAPSVLIRGEELETEIRSAFKLKNLEDLSGARFMMVGHLSGSEKKKIFNFGFAKYIAFVKYRIKDESEPQV